MGFKVALRSYALPTVVSMGIAMWSVLPACAEMPTATPVFMNPSLSSFANAGDDDGGSSVDISEIPPRYRKMTPDEVKESRRLMAALSQEFSKLIFTPKVDLTSALDNARKLLDLYEKTFGPDHPETITALEFYVLAARLSNAKVDVEPLLARLQNIARKTYGTASVEYADALTSVAEYYEYANRAPEAEQLFKQVLTIAEKRKDDDAVNDALDNLGRFYARQFRFSESEACFRRLLAQYDKLVGVANERSMALFGNRNINNAVLTDTEERAQALINLAFALLHQGKSSEALSSVSRALDIKIRLDQSSLDAANNAGIFMANTSLLSANTGGGMYAKTMRFTAIEKGQIYRDFLRVAATAINLKPEDKPLWTDLAFAAVQTANLSQAGDAVIMATVRRIGTPEQISLVENEQKLSRSIASIYAKMMRKLDAAVANGDDLDAEDAESTTDFDLNDGLQIQTDLTALQESSRKLRDKYPEYYKLIRPDALSISDVQSKLAQDQAVVLFSEYADDVYVFVVTKTKMDWHAAKGGRTRIDESLAKLKCQNDSEGCDPDTKASKADFDQGAAYQLYNTTLKPLSPILAGVKRLYSVTYQNFSALPIDLMITEDPAATGGELTRAKWLSEQYAVTVLPSIASLKLAYAQAPASSGDDLPFVGYGAPNLAGTGKGLRDSHIDDSWFTKGQGDIYLARPDKLRTLPPLPGTTQELNAVAASLGVFGAKADQVIHVGNNAEEARFRSDNDLSHARVISIATHGILPGDYDNIAEPGLVFTPPAQASPQNDGLLTASEAVSLKLRANWVILSACNTATAAGNWESLSSLATSFFYAGAESLMASHWRVDDQATTQLITLTLKNYSSGTAGITKSQALQQAQSMLRAQNPEYAHPRYWAAFSVISNQDR